MRAHGPNRCGSMIRSTPRAQSLALSPRTHNELVKAPRHQLFVCLIESIDTGGLACRVVCMGLMASVKDLNQPERGTHTPGHAATQPPSHDSQLAPQSPITQPRTPIPSPHTYTPASPRTSTPHDSPCRMILSDPQPRCPSPWPRLRPPPPVPVLADRLTHRGPSSHRALSWPRRVIQSRVARSIGSSLVDVARRSWTTLARARLGRGSAAAAQAVQWPHPPALIPTSIPVVCLGEQEWGRRVCQRVKRGTTKNTGRKKGGR